MSSSPAVSPTASPTEASKLSPTITSQNAASAHDRIAAILEDSDDEDQDTSEEKTISISLSRSQDMELNNHDTAATFDLDLDDEVLTHADSEPRDELFTADTQDDGSAAYARLMKSLYSKPSRNTATVQEITSKPAMEASAPLPSDDSDDDVPVRKARPSSKPKASPTPRSSSPQLPQDSRSPSPNLFVSPAQVRRGSLPSSRQSNNGSEWDEMSSTIANPKLKALIAKKRAERKEMETAERKKAQAAQKAGTEKQKAMTKQLKEIYSSEMDDGMTEDAQKSLTENSRPTQRKASKKALEEMNRETQRMARNQQLTHQARVKRKITTLDFVKSFGLSVNATSGSERSPFKRERLDSSDNEHGGLKSTPPSSPPSLNDDQVKDSTLLERSENDDEYIIRTGPDAENEHEELPSLDQLLSDPIPRPDKGKGKAIESSPHLSDAVQHPSKIVRRQVRIPDPTGLEDSDDELEIVNGKKPSRFAIFDKVPEKKSHEPASLIHLRAMAHLSPPSKNRRDTRHSITQAELHTRLAKEMHKQTVAEKQERLEALKARGIVFKTEAEMEEDQLYIENMLEKARKEAMELGRIENEAAKKAGEDIDENYALPSDDESEDGNFEEEDEEEDEAEVDLSGSEDEDAGAETAGTGMFDDEAEDAEDEDEEEEAEGAVAEEDADDANMPDVDEDAAPIVGQKPRSKARNRNVIVDDDDEDETEVPPTPTTLLPVQSQTAPINAFGFALPNASMGLTQMFQGTMAELASQDNTQNTPGGQFLDFLRDVPAPTLPNMSPVVPPTSLLIANSQSNLATPAKQQQRGNSDTPRLTPRFPTPAGIGSQASPTKQSEIPEPTQDAGFDNFRRSTAEVPFSTVDTVLMPVSDSPAVQRKGKLRRRALQAAELSDEEVAENDDATKEGNGEFELTTDAFDALFKANKKPAVSETFDKKRSAAKNVVEDQAEESEDEYAGLGGASDDESDNEVDEEVQKMIDEGPVDVKEGELAKFFADKDRADDEKRVDKLYRDITTGALRRKRGAGLDELSDDSDDEAAERRRQKQRKFAKMRKALLEDENVGKIAENPKKLAFLRAIEDRDDDDGVDYFGQIEDAGTLSGSQLEATQDEDQPTEAGHSGFDQQPAVTDLKRKLPADFQAVADNSNNATRDMSHRRRPAAQNDSMNRKRPTTIAEIRESLSFLIDEPLVPGTQASDHSDDEDEEYTAYDEPSRRPSRTDSNGSAVLTTVRASVVNRLTVSRNNSMSIDEESSSTGLMAFHTSTSTTNGVFKVPSLLRRATTNLSTTSSTSSGTTTPTNNENAVRMGGSKKSNIHFQAREAERMKKVQEADRRRREGIRKSVVGKGRRSVLGNSLGGRNSGFE